MVPIWFGSGKFFEDSNRRPVKLFRFVLKNGGNRIKIKHEALISKVSELSEFHVKFKGLFYRSR